MARAKKSKWKQGEEPYVDNYPDLRDWLKKHGAKCWWQLEVSGGNAFVEQWVVGPRSVALIVVVHAKGHGWEIFTACQSNKVSNTLNDAEERLGLR